MRPRPTSTDQDQDDARGVAPDEARRRMLESYLRHSDGGQPVHAWYQIGGVEDLMYALNASKPGQTVTAVVLRAGKEARLLTAR